MRFLRTSVAVDYILNGSFNGKDVRAKAVFLTVMKELIG